MSLKRKIKNWIKKNNVLDVLIFGSFVRGKSNYNDIDLCILIKDDDEDKVLDLIDSLGSLSEELQVNHITEKELIFGKGLSKTLIEEGMSVVNNKKLSKVLGFKAMSLVFYSLDKFSNSERVRFHYMLKGRNSKGVLEEVKGKIVGGGVILLPVSEEDNFKEVLEDWNVKYRIDRVLI